MTDISIFFEKEAETLKTNIRKHCWDERDRFYYSVDLNLLPVEKPDIKGLYPGDLYLHVGQPRTYDCLIQRFSVWSGFMAMWLKLQRQNKLGKWYRYIFVIQLLLMLLQVSVRFLPWKKCINVRASGNPSSWAGPIWINVNYLVFRGLLQYGYEKEAREVAEKTILLLGRDFERFGALHEYYLPIMESLF